LILSGFPYFELSTIRIPGVLQRIAIVYLFTSIIYLKFDKKVYLHLTWIILLVYWALLTLIPVPGVGFANMEPETNLVAWLDRYLLSGHLWSATKVWDPEGILSTIPAISTALIGVLVGDWLKSENENKTKTVWLFVIGNLLIFLGYVWSGWFPLNKGLWTSSYVLYTGGLAIVVFALCYWFIDVLQIKWWIKPFQVYGLNAITVFFLSGIIGRLLYIIKISNNGVQDISVKQFLFSNLFLSWLSPINASLLWAVSYVLIWLGLMWILYKKNIFIKV
jgi:predicted acyltransferase